MSRTMYIWIVDYVVGIKEWTQNADKATTHGDSHFLSNPPHKTMDSNAHTLASDLLWKISGHLETEPDVRRFRSVCNCWRSSTPPLPPKATPVLRLPVFSPNPGEDSSHYCTLTESTIYCVKPLRPKRFTTTTGASPCWVVRLQFSESGTVIFKNLGSPHPLEKESEEAKLLPKVLDLRDFQVREICKAYTLEFVNQNGGSSYDRDIKVAVSSCFSEIGDGFTVMALKKEGNLLGIWRMGDDKWSFDIGPALEMIPRMCFHGIAYHKGKFYVVDEDGGTSTFDPVSLEIRHQVVPREYISSADKYLVQAFGDLFLVAYTCSVPDVLLLMHVGFRVRKLDEQRGRWVREESGLKDRLLFVTPDWLGLVLAKDFPGYKGNCVYFVHHLPIVSGYNHLPRSSLLDPDPGSVRFLCGFPCCSKLFWPPPTWLRKNPSTSPMGALSNSCFWRKTLLVLVTIAALWMAQSEDYYFTRFLSCSLVTRSTNFAISQLVSARWFSLRFIQWLILL
ncbi:hypothetical protein Tsubulata_033962 [Turnera subulata]|uniref:KIB1-4 beta-propeller domain-containing protein n=1 Tax=Turnera subulata TaxID=218843 RepID=A0A9Q0J5Z3_9ROSI|nr:hypothetical protein Tsubulata_033962 [Turnera subulata]